MHKNNNMMLIFNRKKGGNYQQKKKSHQLYDSHIVSNSSVRAKGIEPIRLSAPDPKSGLSTNFNTPAKPLWPFRMERIANVRYFIEFANYQKQIPIRRLKLRAMLGL